MKRLLSISLLLSALCVPRSAFSQWIPTNEVDGTIDGASYDISTTGFYGDYFCTYFYCVYPQWTNGINSWSRSGSSFTGDYESQEEKWAMPFWASFRTPGYDWFLANDNGGYDSNGTYQAGLLLAGWPPNSWNGTASTNEGVTTSGLTHIPVGRVPHDSPDGDSGAIAGNAASMALAQTLGVPVIDLWDRLWTNGWSSDVTGARLLGFSAGSHPFAAGGLAIATHQLLGLNVETNIGSLCFDWAGARAFTNHWVVISMSVSGNTLTATAHADRMPMAWDANTNFDARGAFVAMPSIGNAFNWIVQVTNLPSGNYDAYVDGQFVDSGTAAQWAAGRNWATNCAGPFWLQRSNVLAWKRWQQGVDPLTLVLVTLPNHVTHIPNAADNVIYQSHTGQNYDTFGLRGTAYLNTFTNGIRISDDIAQLRQYDQQIWQAAQQTNHTIVFSNSTTPLPARFAPFHR